MSADHQTDVPGGENQFAEDRLAGIAAFPVHRKIFGLYAFARPAEIGMGQQDPNMAGEPGLVRDVLRPFQVGVGGGRTEAKR